MTRSTLCWLGLMIAVIHCTGLCAADETFIPEYSLIVGGVEAAPHSCPWQISLRRYYKYDDDNDDGNDVNESDDDNRGTGENEWTEINQATEGLEEDESDEGDEFMAGTMEHYCGGSILNKHWIITAAHCVYQMRKSLLDVVVGLHRRHHPNAYTKVMNIDKIVVYPDYGTVSFNNDIALIRLTHSIQFNIAVQPVGLPSEQIKTGTMCLTSGWGSTINGIYPDALRKVEIQVQSSSQCNSRYGYGFTSDMICTGQLQSVKGTCFGDSGGPLVSNERGVYVLQGLTSWGDQECRDYSVFLRVYNYKQWILPYISGQVAAQKQHGGKFRQRQHFNKNGAEGFHGLHILKSFLFSLVVYLSILY